MFDFSVRKKFNVSLYFTVVFIFGLVCCDMLIEDPLMYQIYMSYVKAQNIDEGTVSARRVFTHNKNYEIHVIKLEEVNGKKRHNLLVKESNASNPLIYIDNPVETNVPHAYLTFEEFKKELNDRVIALRQEFYVNTNKTHPNLNLTKKETFPDKHSYKNGLLEEYSNFSDDKKLKSKENNNRTTKITKTKSKGKVNNKTVNVTKINRKGKTKQTLNITKVTKTESPAFRIFTLATDAEETAKNKHPTVRKEADTKSKRSTTKSTYYRRNTTEANAIVGIKTTTAIETSIEPSTKTVTTEHPTEPETMRELPMETPETTNETETSTQTTTIIIKEIITKPATLGRPLVWVEGDEKKEDELLMH